MHLTTQLIIAASASASALSRRDDILTYGTPESAGMLSEPLKDMVANLTGYAKTANWTSHSYNQIVPIEPGSATLIARNGIIVSEFAFGKRNLYANVSGLNATYLPVEKQEGATTDTIYDMASLTKMFTTIAGLREIDRCRIKLNGTVASYLPEFGANGKDNVTLLQLMTHTSGLRADPSPGLSSPRYPTYESKIQVILNQTLLNTPGSTYLYSDLNYMTLMLVLENVTGKKLDALVYEFTSLLGMNSTFFNRGNLEGPSFPFYSRMAPQEFQIAVGGSAEPQRPQPVRGTVHDENSWALDGVAGHAGLFSTVKDTAAFCQMVLNNGTYNGVRILTHESVDLIFTNFNARFSGEEHGIGFELNQFYTSGPMASLLTASHTGFTGTSMVIDRPSNTLFIHFSNRVHPSREWASNNIVREAVGYWVARSLGRDVSFPP